ncbi:unnamed protein product [Merluccius merluccius]
MQEMLRWRGGEEDDEMCRREFGGCCLRRLNRSSLLNCGAEVTPRLTLAPSPSSLRPAGEEAPSEVCGGNWLDRFDSPGSPGPWPSLML